MKTSLICLLLGYAVAVNGQPFPSVEKITADLTLARYSADSLAAADTILVKLIQAFDRDFHTIAGYYRAPPASRTFIRGGPIAVRRLIDADSALRLLRADSAKARFFDDIEASHNRDTAAFRKDKSIQWEIEFYYMGYQTPMTTSTVNPAAVQAGLQLKNLIFYNPGMSGQLVTLSRSFRPKQRRAFQKYFSVHYDYYGTAFASIKPKAVSIKAITYGRNNMAYVSADIYGGHYLVAFDSNDNWRYTGKEQLWVY